MRSISREAYKKAYVAEGAVVTNAPGLEAYSCQVPASGGGYMAGLVYFMGREQRPRVSRFRNESLRDAYLAELIQKREALASSKAAERAAVKEKQAEAAAEVAVGSIFCCSWGYEQTNVDYYQVIERNGSNVVIREIGAKKKAGENALQGSCVPVPDWFTGEPMKKRLQGKRIRIADYSSAYLIKQEADGSWPTAYWSSYY